MPFMKHISGKLCSDSAVLSSENLHKHSLTQALKDSAKKFGIPLQIWEEFGLRFFYKEQI